MKHRGRIYVAVTLCATVILVPARAAAAGAFTGPEPTSLLWSRPQAAATGEDFLVIGFARGLEVWWWPEGACPEFFGRVGGDSVVGLAARDSLCVWTTSTGYLHGAHCVDGRLDVRWSHPLPGVGARPLVSSGFVAAWSDAAVQTWVRADPMSAGRAWSPPPPATITAGALRDSTLAVAAGDRVWLLRLSADSTRVLDSLSTGVFPGAAQWIGDTLALAAGFSGLRICLTEADTFVSTPVVLTPPGAYTFLAATTQAWAAYDIFGRIQLFARGGQLVPVTQLEAGGTVSAAEGRHFEMAVISAERGLSVLNVFTPGAPFWSFQRHLPGAVRALTFSSRGMLAMADFAGVYALLDTSSSWIGRFPFNAVDVDTGSGVIVAASLLGGTALFSASVDSGGAPLAVIPAAGFTRTARSVGNRLVVFNTNSCDSGVAVFDISDIQLPVLIGRSSLCASVRDVEAMPGGLAVAVADSGIWTYRAPPTDLSVPDHRTPLADSWSELAWRDGYLWSRTDAGVIARWNWNGDTLGAVDRTGDLGAVRFDVWGSRLATVDSLRRVSLWQWRAGLTVTPQGTLDLPQAPLLLRLVADTLWIAAPDAVIRMRLGGTADVDDPGGPVRPVQAVLEAPFPNPFNSGVALTLNLRPGCWSVTIYDILGRHIKAWSGRALGPGRLRLVWTPAEDRNAPPASGTYLVRAVSGGESTSRKLLYLK